MYYLQSRYYNATVGRFVNGDEAEFIGVNGEILGHNLYSYCCNDAVNNVDYSGFATTSYGGIKCTSAGKGFSVKMHYMFLLKSFCTDFAKHVISVWGKNKKYHNMSAHRIAVEIFGHAILFVVGIIFGTISVANFTIAWMAKKYLKTIVNTSIGVLSAKISNYLYKKTETIDVNSNETWYRMTAFYVIWGIMPNTY